MKNESPGDNLINAACQNNESRFSTGWSRRTGFSQFPWGFAAGEVGGGGSLVLVPGEHITYLSHH